MFITFAINHLVLFCKCLGVHQRPGSHRKEPSHKWKPFHNLTLINIKRSPTSSETFSSTPSHVAHPLADPCGPTELDT
jgi:hypothetical protein